MVVATPKRQPRRAKDWSHAARAVPSFLRQYIAELSPLTRRNVARKFRHLCEQYVQDPVGTLRRYDRVAYLDAEPIELDLDSGWRAVVAVRGEELVLLKAGDHEMIPRRRFTRRDYAKACAESSVEFSPIACQEALDLSAPTDAQILGDALEERWLYTLDEQQAAAVLQIIAPLVDAHAPPLQVLLTGGPGTGKTSVLAQVADALAWDPSQLAVMLTDRVSEYMAVIPGHEAVERCRAKLLEFGKRPVVLVDDPPTWHVLQSAFAEGAYQGARVTVVATDLAQVENVVSDRELRQFLGGQRIQHIGLTDCYRQTAGVGRTSVAFLRQVSTGFTKHIHEYRIAEFARRHVMSIETANEMRFVRPGGYSQVHHRAELDAVRAELRVLRQNPLWSYWPPLCVVVEPRQERVARALAKELAAIPHEVVTLGDTERMRGVEYQHVFVFLSQWTLHEMLVVGRHGLSTDEYLAARNLRIPFSRATDRLVVFGFEEPAAVG